MKIVESFQSINRYALKLQNYLDAYEEILSGFQGKKVVFIEVGISAGGSLQAWRNFFHPDSRIIGVDINPSQQSEMEEEGFEIFIGDQSKSEFWRKVFQEVGEIDILLDDGGHTNAQQITTLISAIPYVRDGGLIMIEDTHTSYIASYMNPSEYSFINYAKLCVDIINDRFYALDRYKKQELIKENIKSIIFYQSIVCFYIDRRRCFVSSEISFGKKSGENIVLPLDFRERDLRLPAFKKFIASRYRKSFLFKFKNSLLVKQIKRGFYFKHFLYKENRRMKSHFHK